MVQTSLNCIYYPSPLSDKPNQTGLTKGCNLGLVALDELESLEALELYIPSRHDPRLQRLISLIVNKPEQSLLLEPLATQ